jgi:hypothetical protein
MRPGRFVRVNFQWRSMAGPGVRFPAAGIRPGLPPRGGHLILPQTLRDGKEELGERRVENRHLVQRAGKNGAKSVANGALVGEIHDVERTSGVVQFAGPDAEAVVTAQPSQKAARFSGRPANGTSASRR